MDELDERFALAERQGLVDIVRAHGQLSILNLLDLIDEGRTGRLLGTLTLGECSTGFASPDATDLHDDKSKLRDTYDARILAALRDAEEPLSPNEVQARVGGSAVEARTALQRLAAAKKVARTWKGRAAGYALP